MAILDATPKNQGKVFDLIDGDGIKISSKTTHFYLICCDCGLMHKIDIEREKDNIILLFKQEPCAP